MFGILIGAAAVAGLVIAKHHRHRHHRHAMAGCGDPWHGGWHDGAETGRGWHGPGHSHGRHGRGGAWRFWGRRAMEHRLLQELDCTPAQERLVREELRGLVDQLRSMRGERDATRDDLARAIAGPELDRAALMAMFTRHDQRLVELRAGLSAALERVHAALDDRQRARLIELVRGGPGGRGGRGGGAGEGPYR